MTELSIQPNILDLEVYDGDSIDLFISLKTSSNTYVTLPSTASAIIWKAQVKNSSGSVIANFSVSASNATSGSALTVYLPPTNWSQTSGLEYDLQVSYSASTEYSASVLFTETYLKGGITVVSDITE